MVLRKRRSFYALLCPTGGSILHRADTLANAKRNRFQTRGAKWKQALAWAVAAWTLGMAPEAFAHPILDAAGAGVNIATNGNVMNITGSQPNNLIKWVDFSISGGKTVDFHDKNYLNYVTGSAVSDIQGTLKGTGSIYLVNPNGILIGDGATVNEGSLYLSTRELPHLFPSPRPPCQFLRGAQRMSFLRRTPTSRTRRGHERTHPPRFASPFSRFASNMTA